MMGVHCSRIMQIRVAVAAVSCTIHLDMTGIVTGAVIIVVDHRSLLGVETTIDMQGSLQVTQVANFHITHQT